MTEFWHVLVSIAAPLAATCVLVGVPLVLALRYPGKPRP